MFVYEYKRSFGRLNVQFVRENVQFVLKYAYIPEATGSSSDTLSGHVHHSAYQRASH